MKLSKSDKRTAVLAEMNRGAKAIDMANKYDVNPNTISSWVRVAKQEALKAKANELAKVDPVVVETVIQEVKEKASEAPNISTAQVETLDASLELLADGVNGLAILDSELQLSLLKAVKWANSKIQRDMKVSEWTQVVDGITKIHSALNVKAGVTQVNIQNNSAGTDFKAGMRL